MCEKTMMRHRLLVRVAILSILAIVFFACTKACAGTEVHFYGCDTNKVDGKKHNYYEIVHYKRGLFLGICLTTKRLEWSYLLDLAGEEPSYNFRQLAIKRDSLGDDAQAGSCSAVAGDVVIDRAHDTISIAIVVAQAGVTNRFIGNGTYTLPK